MYGAAGEDLLLEVPLGTILYDDDTGEQLADLEREGSSYVIPGGRGGLGNMHFRSSTNQTPRQSVPAGPGIEMRIRMELKLLADIGLLGMPNAGKSTFLSRVSAARPKVADYPFTTLVPQLGVVELDDGRSFVIADIPGLVEGAAEGAGLGHQFLRHVERCAGYVHLVSPDPWEAPPAEKLRAIDEELAAYGAGLEERPQLVVLNKIDTLDPDAIEAHLQSLREASGGAPVFAVSGVTGQGIGALIEAAWALVEEARVQRADDPGPVTIVRSADPWHPHLGVDDGDEE
jgi:GTP-binding protein